MPISYFPPLPENVWGNLDGNIDLQTDLIELINSKAPQVGNDSNLIINPNFRIWQRCANQVDVIGRTRMGNVATLETNRPHGYNVGDIVQITSVSDNSYNEPNGATLISVDNTHFSYANIGTDELESSETVGKCLLTSRYSIAPNNAEFTSDRWLALNDSNNLVLSATQGSGVKAQSNSVNKFALMQVISAKDVEQFLTKKLSASIDVKSSGNALVKLALISWTGAANSTNNNAISTWNANGTNPSLATNWNYEAISNAYTLSNTVQTLKLEASTVASSGANNIALLVFFESPTIGEQITLDKAQLLIADKLSDFKPNSYEYDLRQCRRFYAKSYELHSPIYHISESGKISFPTSFGVSDGSEIGNIFFEEMYKKPNVHLYTSTAPPEKGKWRVSSGVNVEVSASQISEKCFTLINNAGFSVSTSSISGHYELIAEI